jgi:hypothetical protein
LTKGGIYMYNQKYLALFLVIVCFLCSLVSGCKNQTAKTGTLSEEPTGEPVEETLDYDTGSGVYALESAFNNDRSCHAHISPCFRPGFTEYRGEIFPAIHLLLKQDNVHAYHGNDTEYGR